ncbi:MAG: UDP-N-acetylmuramoyl-L-alanine--D-glutamate ligase [Clostridiales bacterium]|nr:UDP-N-acetylmuramoyl-L-alanine--D-glutamate ligase [Clostridiales bacterium]
MKILPGQKVLVIGAGLSGLASCRFLLGKGAAVTLWDAKSREELGAEVSALQALGVELLLGGGMPARPEWRLVVKSPGVPPNIPLVKMLRQERVTIIGELELAFSYAAAPFVAITGTNGKTTTAALTAAIFREAGVNTLLGGNIGQPLAELAEGHRDGVIVAEVSSFQLEDCRKFAPHVAAILNITPDHLDRHGSLENYAAVKQSIFERQKKEDFAVLNYDDPLLRPLASKLPGSVFYFSVEQELASGAFAAGGEIFLACGGQKNHVISCKDIYIKGKHNWQNALAAAACAFLMGISPEQIAQTLRSFPGVEHRMEFVASLRGAAYVNDSKGTNPDATMKALLAYDEPVILLAGGRNKGSDFSPLMRLAREKVRLLVLLGECWEEMLRAAREAGVENAVLADSFSQAVELAYAAALPGEVVLLSPACASWDMFANFEERGRLFKALVREKAAACEQV